MSALGWYTSYDPDSGEIGGAFVSSPDDVASNTPAGRFVLEGRFERELHYIASGAAVEYTDEQRAIKRHRPDYPARWSNDLMTWVDRRPPEVRIAHKWAKVREERDQRQEKADKRVLRFLEDGDAVPLVWKQYRQALRDITQQSDPFNIVWPTAPI